MLRKQFKHATIVAHPIAITEPVEIEPVITERVETKPVITERVETEPDLASTIAQPNYALEP